MVAGIRTDNLTKQYAGSATPSLNKLSLYIEKGEVYGFLGSNGAGKSTTIRLLLNFLQPTAGRAMILGHDSVEESVEIRKQIGYLAGDVALYPNVSGKELLHYLGDLQGMKNTRYLQTLTKRFDADLSKPIGKLSKGNRQKIGILQACMHQPEVLILDEPTSGLDPLMQERFNETVLEAKARGATVFLSSHSLSEVQHICDRVGIIKNGTLVREGSLEDFASEQLPTFSIVFRHEAPVAELTKSASAIVLSHKDRTAVVKAHGSIANLLKTLSQFEILDLQTKTQELEEEFMTYYGNKGQSK